VQAEAMHNEDKPPLQIRAQPLKSERSLSVSDTTISTGWVAEWTKATVLKTASAFSQPVSSQEVSDSGLDRVARSVALSLQESPELRIVIEAWSSLPHAIKSGVMALVEAATE
jgi:hypothetical protein